ncbi:hypothetical protein HDV00_008270 [Rhizophlyctis rosea]|nr:hypothetical protein HDV00_008270 [Rhizophlyctis rosea]
MDITNVPLSSTFIQFLSILQHAPLKQFTFFLAHTHGDASASRVVFPPDIVFNSLRSFDTTDNVIFTNYAAVLPNLEKIFILHVPNPDVDTRVFPSLRTLTQPTLRHFMWAGRHWEEILFTLSAATLESLTHLRIMCPDECNEPRLERFAGALSGLRNLTNFGFSTFTRPGLPSFVVSCPKMVWLLSCIRSSKLRTLRFDVIEWNYDQVHGALKERPGLKDVQFYVNNASGEPDFVETVKADEKKLLDELKLTKLQVTVL